jgi:hypothetical protein
MYIKLHIKVPALIERLYVWYLLRYRKKHYGCAFRRIKLFTDKDVDVKHRYAIVDPDDYRKLSQYNWQLYESESKNYYAVRLEGMKIVRMHRVVINAPAGKIVDHRDGEGLNNTKQNLRLATASQNRCNSRPKKNNSSKFKGVGFDKCKGKWRAFIAYNRKYKHLGYFNNEEDAAKAYDEAAKIYHGEFARLNFTTEDTENTKKYKL